MTFLVVDDSRFSRNKLREIIGELGHEVIGEAVDGLDAIEKFKELNPDSITMDLEMPNMKGNAAAKEILALNREVNIFLITSLVDKKELISSLKAGVRKVLTKPITTEQLGKAIEELRMKPQKES